jgi:hypothetical protein
MSPSAGKAYSDYDDEEIDEFDSVIPGGENLKRA